MEQKLHMIVKSSQHFVRFSIIYSCGTKITKLADHPLSEEQQEGYYCCCQYGI